MQSAGLQCASKLGMLTGSLPSALMFLCFLKVVFYIVSQESCEGNTLSIQNFLDHARLWLYGGPARVRFVCGSFSRPILP